LNIILLREQSVGQAADLSLHHALLTNDAVIIALMQTRGLVTLASNDADFDRMAGITLNAPV
jgi:predicted nucleic acid-binding protein